MSNRGEAVEIDRERATNSQPSTQDSPLPRRLKFVPARDPGAGAVDEQQQVGEVVRNGGEGKAGSDGNVLDPGAPLWWEESRRVAAGLENLGNTCFLNSVLQCLTHTPPLAEEFVRGAHKERAIEQAIGGRVLQAVGEHVRKALQASGKVLTPTPLVKGLRQLSKSFRPGRQEDAHELLRALLDKMEEGERGPKAPPGQHHRSSVGRAFGLQLRSQVVCESCHGRSSTHDPAMDLSLELPKGATIERALEHFCSEEVLDGNNKYKCGRERKMTRATKRLTIHRPPNCLVVHLKRFLMSRSGKIDTYVRFPLTLDLSNFVSDTCAPPPAYHLYAVLVHAGRSCHSGHYFSFAKSASGAWHCFDDASVYPASERTVLSQRAYMLFYIRQAPSPPRPVLSPGKKANAFSDAKPVSHQKPYGSSRATTSGGVSVSANGGSASDAVEEHRADTLSGRTREREWTEAGAACYVAKAEDGGDKEGAGPGPRKRKRVSAVPAPASLQLAWQTRREAGRRHLTTTALLGRRKGNREAEQAQNGVAQHSGKDALDWLVGASPGDQQGRWEGVQGSKLSQHEKVVEAERKRRERKERDPWDVQYDMGRQKKARRRDKQWPPGGAESKRNPFQQFHEGMKSGVK